MSTPLFVLVVEIIVILAGLVVLLLFFRWKSKQVKTRALEELLDDMTGLEDSRQQLLFQHLQKAYALDDEKAIESSIQLINAEKQFMQQFILQQAEQSSMSDFYQTLCELLDQYLNIIPTLSSPGLNLTANIAEIDNEEYPLIEGQSQVEKNNNTENESITAEQTASIEEAEPDWDDAFSESGDELDKASKDSITNETATATDAEIDTNNDDEEELNWDDAFSESGDTMDEVTKQEMDSEQKKDSGV